MTTLAEIAPGQRGMVQRVQGHDAIALRLMEMGLTPGCAVEFVSVAPLGDPIEISLRGYRLSLRLAEAARVEIQLA